MAMRTTPAPNHPVEIIELQFPTFLASLRTGDARAFHANMVFIESLSTTAYTTKEWTAQNGSFRFSTKHDALQRVFRLLFAIFPGCKRTCVYTCSNRFLGRVSGPPPILSRSVSLQYRRYERTTLSLGPVWTCALAGLGSASRGEEHFRALCHPSVVESADALGRESCDSAQLAGRIVDPPAHDPLSMLDRLQLTSCSDCLPGEPRPRHTHGWYSCQAGTCLQANHRFRDKSRGGVTVWGAQKGKPSCNAFGYGGRWVTEWSFKEAHGMVMKVRG